MSNKWFPDMFPDEGTDFGGEIEERMLTGEEAEAVYFSNKDFYDSGNAVNYNCEEDPAADFYHEEDLSDDEFQDLQLRLGLTPEFIARNRPYKRREG